ncbi:hypothetical protein [Longispora fulva]|uniref:Uncharacterized protein n=1 Tax=Longispora fulva TaxID=619741 RepID=A0A8J7KJA0_9ACTN|nr:hypothetical protein [Longispora fulva]MBG6135246.1 hypothetical protein [Longispora fulva]
MTGEVDDDAEFESDEVERAPVRAVSVLLGVLLVGWLVGTPILYLKGSMVSGFEYPDRYETAHEFGVLLPALGLVMAIVSRQREWILAYVLGILCAVILLVGVATG